MRLLFDIDSKDYGACTHTYVRNSARAVIIRKGRIAMVHSLKYDYYKFPGGGIEPGERNEQAVIRETYEEAGLRVIPETIREYGYVRRIQKSEMDGTECFIQDNFYYLCETDGTIVPQKLDDYEAEERFTLEFIRPEEAIRANRLSEHGPKDLRMIEREAKVLDLLIEEGLFGNIRIQETELNDDILRQLISLSDDWAQEENCHGYRKNEKSDIEGNRIFVAEDDTGVIGYLFGHKENAQRSSSVMPDGTPVFEVEELYVKPHYRSRGIGRKLLSYAENMVSDDVEYLMLSTATKNWKAILHFYLEECGMEFWSARLFKKVKRDAE